MGPRIRRAPCHEAVSVRPHRGTARRLAPALDRTRALPGQDRCRSGRHLAVPVFPLRDRLKHPREGHAQRLGRCFRHPVEGVAPSKTMRPLLQRLGGAAQTGMVRVGVLISEKDGHVLLEAVRQTRQREPRSHPARRASAPPRWAWCTTRHSPPPRARRVRRAGSSEAGARTGFPPNGRRCGRRSGCFPPPPGSRRTGPRSP